MVYVKKIFGCCTIGVQVINMFFTIVIYMHASFSDRNALFSYLNNYENLVIYITMKI